MAKKLYISAPENIRNSDDYAELKKKLAYQVSNILNEDYQTIGDSNLNDSDDSSDLLNLYHDLYAMSNADLVVFYPKWSNDKKCRIEHEICFLYNLNYYTLDISSYPDEVNCEECTKKTSSER